MLDLFSLEDDVAVVTGSSAGIGKGVALCLAEAGAAMIVAGRDRKTLSLAVDEIRQRGGRAAACAVDVTSSDGVRQLSEAAISHFGKVSIWVNNVGAKPDKAPRAVVDIDADDFDAHIDVVLRPAWMGSVEAARVMGDGGCIVNISTRIATPAAQVGHGLYAALKLALNGLTATLSNELAPRIRVNAVAPGSVLTNSFYATRNMSAAEADALLPKLGIPLQRYGTPQDIGAAVVYLASRAAGWVTGQCLHVSGGKF